MSLNDEPSPSFDDIRKAAESRGHNRQLSEVSTISFISTTSSELSVVTRRSSSFSEELRPFIYRQQESIPGTVDAIRPEPSRNPLKAILKTVFRRSWQSAAPNTAVVVQTPGLVDNTTLRQALKTGHGGTTSFKMSPQSYVGYGQLEETLDYLYEYLPNLEEIVLSSQVYILEELDRLTPSIARFSKLRSLTIHDALDDPPTVCPTLTNIISQWAAGLPSLLRVQFRSDTWWEPVLPEKGEESQWTECSM